jgi:hypothetical protein
MRRVDFWLSRQSGQLRPVGLVEGGFLGGRQFGQAQLWCGVQELRGDDVCHIGKQRTSEDESGKRQRCGDVAGQGRWQERQFKGQTELDGIQRVRGGNANKEVLSGVQRG